MAPKHLMTRRSQVQAFAYDKSVKERLWELSEKETGFDWKL